VSRPDSGHYQKSASSHARCVHSAGLLHSTSTRPAHPDAVSASNKVGEEGVIAARAVAAGAHVSVSQIPTHVCSRGGG